MSSFLGHLLRAFYALFLGQHKFYASQVSAVTKPFERYSQILGQLYKNVMMNNVAQSCII